MCVVSSTVTMSDYVQQGITDLLLAKHLEALRKTVVDVQQCDFWHAVRMFSDLDSFYQKLTLLSWAAYFPPLDNDCASVAARVFCIISGLVPHGSPTPPSADNPQFRVEQYDGRLALFIADDEGVERQVLCYAPVSAYIPQNIHELLPTTFLRSAIVDSYVAEKCILEYDRERFEHTVVYPGLSIANPAAYRPMSSAARAVKEAVSDELFLVMLDLDIIAAIEGQLAETYTW